ncbi:hypothetical protein KSP39_PZI018557 [Platanthera zijinensis]|uniref:Uncharacterized protein n=1 Tax=Platanthera zijinensis TaxID=2320716 RepID=A0AAP0FYQ6_9ASPA
MGNSLRLCIACLLPCGALDVVRVVHISGKMEEYSRIVTAGEILAANPDHVISRPCSQGGGVSRRIFVVSAADELKRGHIYFLIPAAAIPGKNKRRACKERTVAAELLPVKKAGSRRRQSGRVAVWQPHLESILEDL